MLIYLIGSLCLGAGLLAGTMAGCFMMLFLPLWTMESKSMEGRAYHLIMLATPLLTLLLAFGSTTHAGSWLRVGVGCAAVGFALSHFCIWCISTFSKKPWPC